MRLDKWVSLAGISRKQARQAISAGRVRVNGEKVRDGAQAVEPGARVELDGREIQGDTRMHLMLYKPAGVVTATEDARERTVIDLLPTELRKRGLGPVGRLDKDVTGLVLLTTDGQLAHRLISPRWEAEKVYIATVEGRLDEDCTRAFAAGIDLGEFKAKPAKLALLRAGDEESTCEVRVTEGKYHQVKRMLKAVGHPVRALFRASVAGIALDDALAPGEWRPLTAKEVAHIYTITELNSDE